MPVINNGAKFMQAVTYTGNGSTQTINVGFQPDLVWIKSRSAATDHKLVDSVRGATLALISNSTGAETTDSTGVTAFTSTGFTLGANSTYNNNGATYVAWCWKKGATPGFDIVTYTGTGVARTVSHSLGVAPSMIITKQRNANTDAIHWCTYHVSLGNTSRLLLNTTDAVGTGSTAWNSTSPTSTVFSVGAAVPNNSGQTYVAYLFAEIAGFSKFGSYTGNGSADGPFVYCGFRPKYVMVKQSSASGQSWLIWDTSRNPYNVSQYKLGANTSSYENDPATLGHVGANMFDIVSNGMKARSTDAGMNSNGATYIYAAFAENPLKYANAR